MSTTRLSKTRIEHSFSIVPNDLTFSNDLTLSEKGALIWLLAKPERYGINTKSLATHWHVGTHTVKRISKKLQQIGYLEIQKLSTGETIWHITDTPIEPNKPLLDCIRHEPHVEKRHKATEQAIEPHVEKPHVGKRHVLERTDLLPSIDHKDINTSSSKDEHINIEFEKLYSHWPNNKNKKRSVSAFKTLTRNKSPDSITNLVNGLIADIAARLKANQLGFANMMLTTYLNNERWNDDVTSPNDVKKNSTTEQQSINDRANRLMEESRKRFNMDNK